MIWSSKITNALSGCCWTRLFRSCRMFIRACAMSASMSRMPVYHVAAARYHSTCPSTSPAGGNAAVRCHLEFGIISPVFASVRGIASRTEAHRMAKDGFKVMDSDMHIVEPADLWERYIDPAFKDRAPRGLRRHLRDLGANPAMTSFTPVHH